jgi:hypothetical protein
MAYDVDPDASSLSTQNIQLPFQPRAVTINQQLTEQYIQIQWFTGRDGDSYSTSKGPWL